MPTGRYLEDWRVGEVLITPGRTTYGADADWFERWIGVDHLPPPAAWPRVVLLACALVQRLGVLEGVADFNLGSRWQFHRAVNAGDTVTAYVTCREARPSRSRSGRGILGLTIELRDQHQQPIAVGEWNLLIHMRPAVDAVPATGAGLD